MNQEPVDYQDIVFRARDILKCGDVCNVIDKLASLNTRYNDALARIAALEREKAWQDAPRAPVVIGEAPLSYDAEKPI